MTNVYTPYTSLPPTVGALTGDEIVAVVQGGTTKQTTTREISAASVSNFPAAIGFIIDGFGSNITTGYKGSIIVPFDCTLQSVTLLGSSAAANFQVDIWKSSYTAYTGSATSPSAANSITGGSPPEITSSYKYTNSTLTSWVSSFGEGDILSFNVISASSMYRVTISLQCERGIFS